MSRAFRAAIADDRVPVTGSRFLILIAICKEKASMFLNVGPPSRPRQEMSRAVNSTVNSSLFLAARIVTGSLVNSVYFTIRKGAFVEAGRLMRVVVEPKADRFVWLQWTKDGVN